MMSEIRVGSDQADQPEQAVLKTLNTVMEDTRPSPRRRRRQRLTTGIGEEDSGRDAPRRSKRVARVSTY